MESSATSTGRKTLAQSGQTDPREQRITRTSGTFTPMLWNGHPLETMFRLSRDMDQLMDSFFGGRFGFPRFSRDQALSTAAPELWSPNIDMRQSGDTLLVTAELPGVTRNEVQIEATEDGIAISGERRESREEGGRERDYHLSERSYGRFQRVIPLPDGAQAEQAKASMRDGVLEIAIPCKQSAKRRQIPISD